MVDKRSYRNYFDTVIKFDPVNNYYIFTIDELKELKKSINDETISQLKDETEELFSYEKMSVTTKSVSIDGISKNDYVSLATYWWKDETKPDGLPYISKDGYANPEGNLYDKDKFRLLAYITYYGALMYYLTEEERYNQLLMKHLDYWFIDDIARMNPNMNHAQYIPGVNNGRGMGIIDYAANFAYSLHMLIHLRNFNMLNQSIEQGLKEWHEDFHYWCKTSKNGIDEKNAVNNHGTMFDMMMLVIDQFLDNEVDYKTYKRDLDSRLTYQVDNTGLLPLEVKRTKSKSYSLMGAKGLYDIASLIEIGGSNYDNELLMTMIEFHVEMLVKKVKPWPYEQVTVYDESVLLPLIMEYKKRTGVDYINTLDVDDIVFKIPAYLFNLI